MAFEGSPIAHRTMTTTQCRGRPLTFVFGSNRGGTHGAGAARHAKRFFGAVHGTGEGLMGQCYALPTKSTPSRYDTLPLSEVLAHVATFKQVARDNPDRLFQVTRVGCGLARLAEYEDTIRDAFLDAPANCVLPGVWEQVRQPGMVRLVVAGSRNVMDYEALSRWLDILLAQRDPANVSIVSGTAPGVDRMGEAYAESRGLPVWQMPALWKEQGKAAGFIRNQQMSWFGTHLAAMWDGQSPGTRGMIDLATRDTLAVRVKRTDNGN